MSKLLIEPHYLGSLEYFTLLSQYDAIELEVNDTFKKQTYRNRAHFLGANKVHALIVPLSYGHQTKTKDVKIDYNQRWIKDHWGAFYSYYGKAPFFEFFSEDYKAIWEQKPTFLIDLLLAFFRFHFKILGMSQPISTTTSFEDQGVENDFRNVILPKESFNCRKIYHPVPYIQLFGDNFVSNLSVVDLIMSQGTESPNTLQESRIRGQ